MAPFSGEGHEPRKLRVFAVEDLTPDQIAALKEPLPADQDEALDAELENWMP